MDLSGWGNHELELASTKFNGSSACAHLVCHNERTPDHVKLTSDDKDADTGATTTLVKAFHEVDTASKLYCTSLESHMNVMLHDD